MLLQLGRDICGQRSIAERREWLVTNGIGGYACGTVAGLLTRHYHGLLVAALKPPLERTLLFTKLDEQVSYGGETYQLGANRWADGSVSPQGYQYIESFALEGTIPTWSFAFGDALLEKRIWMEQGENTTYIHYVLRRGSQDATLSLKALVNYRNHHASTRATDWQMQVSPQRVSPQTLPMVPDATPPGKAHDHNHEPLPLRLEGVAITAFDQATPIYLFTDVGACTPHHGWYRGYDLAVERDRGISPNDDHLLAASFEVTLAVGQGLTVVATTQPPATIHLNGAIKRQRGHNLRCLGSWYGARHLSAQQSPVWMEQLVLAADQFVVARPVEAEEDGKTVIAGYPWFGDWGRDTMIALPGLTIATGRPAIARPILRTFARYLDQGMLPNLFPEAGAEPAYNTVDAILWYFEAIRVYYAVTQDQALLKELFPALVEVIHWHQKGTRYNIHLDDDGLLYAGEAGAQLTWMDAKIGDWVVTPRMGKPIEVNALWYNALLTMGQFADLLGDNGDDYRTLADQTRQGFQRFWSAPMGYCYDLLDGPDGNDPSLRPNQIFAVAFPSPDCWRPDFCLQKQPKPELLGPVLLPHAQQKAVVDTVAQHLLTSFGLRSLAPHQASYSGHYGGSPEQRDSHYHQGPVWGWLIGPFVQAHLQVYQNPVLARSFLAPMAHPLQNGCLGSLGEIFDGDPPHRPRGAFAQAWTVAETLRAWCLTDNAFAWEEYRLDQGIGNRE